MRERYKKCIRLIIWGILFELIIFVSYKQYSYFNYASIPPTYVTTEQDQNNIAIETYEIPVAAGQHTLELLYKCTVETEWQIVDADNEIILHGVLDPAQERMQQAFEVSVIMDDNNIENDARTTTVRFVVQYAKEGSLSIEYLRLDQGKEDMITLQGKDFHCSYLGFQDGKITEYYHNVGRQEFYGLNPYQKIVVHNNTSDILYFDLNNCVDYENPQSIITAKKLEVDESWQFYSNEPISYQVVLYTTQTQLEDISVTVDNKTYMDEYKASVITMMGATAVMVLLLATVTLAGKDKFYKKYWNIASVFLYITGMLFYILSIEPYTVNFCLLISIFIMTAYLLLGEDKAAEYCQEYNIIYTGIFTILLSVGMYIMILNSREGTLLSYLSPMNGRGLLLYVLFVITSILIFIIGSSIVNRHNAVFRRVNQYLNCKEALLLGIMLGNFLFKDHVGVELLLDWKRWQLFLVLAMLAAITICLYNIKSDRKQNDRALKALYLFEIIGVQINKTLINIYGADSLTFGETHHISAYYDEITYIAKGEPFRGGGGELYGHYAVFWRLPMMIFGNNLKVIGIVAGIVAAITFFFFILAIHRLFRSWSVKIMVSLALWCMFISSGSSVFSSIPHRYVFFSIILYLMVRWQTMDLSIKRRMIGHLLCVMALLWNTESGLCVSLAWAVYIVIREIERKDNCFWLAVRKLLIQIAIVGIEMILFFASIELYNRILCVDKANESEISAQDKEMEISELNILIQRESEESETDPSMQEGEQENTSQNDLGDFVSKNTGVLFDSNFMGDNMNGKYRFENQPLFSAMIFILLVSFYFLSGMGFTGKTKPKEYAASILAVCVFGLMLFSYSASRDFRDITKCGIPFLIVFFLMFEKAVSYMKKHPKKYTLKNNIVYLLCFFMLIGLVQMELNCFVKIEKFDELLNEKHILDYNSMQRDMEEFAYYVPEDTYAYGNGIAEIYMSIGREIPDSSNTQYIVTDAWRDVEDMPYVKVRDIQVGRYLYTLYYNQGNVK